MATVCKFSLELLIREIPLLLAPRIENHIPSLSEALVGEDFSDFTYVKYLI